MGGLFQNGIIRKYCCGFGCGCGALTLFQNGIIRKFCCGFGGIASSLLTLPSPSLSPPLPSSTSPSPLPLPFTLPRQRQRCHHNCCRHCHHRLKLIVVCAPLPPTCRCHQLFRPRRRLCFCGRHRDDRFIIH